MSFTKSEQFDALAKVHHIRNAEFLRAAHDNTMLPLYRDICFKLARDASLDATKCYALARSYRLRGE